MSSKLYNFFVFLFGFGLLSLVVTTRISKLNYAAVYVDSHGEEWTVPPNNTINKAAEFILDMIPRGNYKFKYVSPVFDLNNKDYVESTVVYILFGVLIAVLFIIICLLILIFKYCCGLCGGKLIPRGGYSTFQLDSTRGSILVLSFILEFLLIYGYFATTDLDNSISHLSDSFKDYSSQLQKQFDVIINSLPEKMSTYYDKASFAADLEYTKKAAAIESENSISLFDRYESIRMLLIIVGLVAATVACSVGIAAGAVHRSWPIIVMVVLSMVGGAVLLISFAYHYIFAKMLREFCTDSGTYIDSRNEDFLPQRLQFFLPCISSPLFPYIENHFYINAIMDTQKFADTITEKDIYKPTFNNVSSDYYSNYVKSIKDSAQKTEVQKLLNTAINISSITLTIDQSNTCRWTKEMYRNEQFLMCRFAMDAGEMLVLTQGISAFLMVIITYTAIGAIKKFKWAATVNKAGFQQNGENGFAGRPIRNKRKE